MVLTTGAIRCAELQSNRNHQKLTSSFLSPNQQCQNIEGGNITLHGLAHPKLTWGVFQLCLRPLNAPHYFGGVLSSRWSALWLQYPSYQPGILRANPSTTWLQYPSYQPGILRANPSTTSQSYLALSNNWNW